MTQRDKWAKRPCVVRYREFADKLREHWFAQEIGDFPDEGAAITFYIPMPKSWNKSARRAYRGTPHRQKPDLDNLIKAVMDALLGDDSTVWSLERQQKLWAEEGSIVITHSSLTETP